MPAMPLGPRSSHAERTLPLVGLTVPPLCHVTLAVTQLPLLFVRQWRTFLLATLRHHVHWHGVQCALHRGNPWGEPLSPSSTTHYVHEHKVNVYNMLLTLSMPCQTWEVLFHCNQISSPSRTFENCLIKSKVKYLIRVKWNILWHWSTDVMKHA